MIAIGYHGPMLLEDHNDLAGMMESTRRVVRRRLWVDEFRDQDEADVIDTLI
jgi:hypothetical protein